MRDISPDITASFLDGGAGVAFYGGATVSQFAVVRATTSCDASFRRLHETGHAAGRDGSVLTTTTRFGPAAGLASAAAVRVSVTSPPFSATSTAGAVTPWGRPVATATR